MSTTAQSDLYLGFDLSTQQLKAITVDADLKLAYSATVDFDAEFAPKYGTAKGTLTNPAEGEIYMPVAMWLEALDLVLARLAAAGLAFARVKGLSGAGMQHGTVFWARDAEQRLSALDPAKTLVDQLAGAFSHPHSPNWQDSSTQTQCDAFNAALAPPPNSSSAEHLAHLTGSAAHHRFSGPQIMRFREKYPARYAQTGRISLVSSFIASVFLGAIAPIDIADACGMNLWHIQAGSWHRELLALAAGGGAAHADELARKLGAVPEDGGQALGRVHAYFVRKYGFAADCAVAPSTGDNPATILSLPLRPGDAMVSLGTSTTFLMTTRAYAPDPAFHFMNHPASAGVYMFMLCYKNGGLAREHVRDALNAAAADAHAPPGSWDAFNKTALETPPLGIADGQIQGKMGLYFPLPEIVPNVPAGQWTFNYDATSKDLTQVDDPASAGWRVPADHARAILESQFLSLRLRSRALVTPQESAQGATLPAQPRRVYLVGGGSVNPAIAQLAGDVLGGAEGVFRLELGGNACALGAAYKAAWAQCRRVAGAGADGAVRGGRDTETFEAFVGARWREDAFVRRIGPGYRAGTYEFYGDCLAGFERAEERVLSAVRSGGGEEGVRPRSVSYGTQAPAAGQV